MSMSQKTQSQTDDVASLKTTHGHSRRELDSDDEHPLSDMEQKREAPIEVVAENVVKRYDERRNAIREYLANAHTACIRAARYELEQAGVTDVDMSNVRDVLDTAQTEVNYEPVITVEYNRDPEARWTLRIKDNGIGIPSNVARAIRDIGLSGWHNDGTTNGAFGQGTMSGFLLSGIHGEYHQKTKARQTDESYRVAWTLTDLNHLAGGRDQYGTTFEWPTFCTEAQDIDVQDAVRTFAEAMVIPVRYIEYDEDGTEIENEDYLPDHMEDRYPDDALVVSYEDQFGKAVWSPEDPDSWNTSQNTFCGYQPIDRNTPGFGKNSYEMPSVFDFRLKDESGPIIEVDGDMDHELVGKTPVSKADYESRPAEQQAGMVPREELPEDANVLVAPSPTDDRDRFEKKHVEATMKRYSEKLMDEYKDHVADVFEQIDEFEDVFELDGNDMALFNRGVDRFGPKYHRSSADTIQETLEDKLGVTLDTEVCKKIEMMKERVSLAPRDCHRPEQKGYRTEKPVWKVIRKATDGDSDGDVYMGHRISPKKAELVWQLDDDNQVIQTTARSKLAERFDWKYLKELPNGDYEAEFPDVDFDDDFIRKYDNGNDDSTAGHYSVLSDDAKNMGLSHERAKQREVTVRRGSGKRNIEKTVGEKLREQVDNGDISISHRDYSDLIVYDQTNDNSVTAGSHIASHRAGVCYVVVPSYVCDYLLESPNAYTEDAWIEAQLDGTFDLYWSRDGRSSKMLREMGEEDVLLSVDDNLWDVIQSYDIESELRDEIEDRVLDDDQQIQSLTLVENEDDMYEHWAVLNRHGPLTMDEYPSPVNVSGVISSSYGRESISAPSFMFDTLLGDLDRDAPEWGYFDVTPHDEDMLGVLRELQANGGFVSTDDDSEVPCDVYDFLGPEKSRYGQVDLSRDDLYVSKTLDRIEEHCDLSAFEADDSDGL